MQFYVNKLKPLKVIEVDLRVIEPSKLCHINVWWSTDFFFENSQFIYEI